MYADYFILYFLIVAGVVAVTWQWSALRAPVRVGGIALFVALTILVVALATQRFALDAQARGILQSLWVVITTTVTARLLSNALRTPRHWSQTARDAALAVVLVALLAGLLVQEALWDELEDGLNAIALWYAGMLASLVIAVLWFLDKAAPRYMGGIFALCIILAGWGTLHFAMSLSPVQLTARGAETTHTALLQYHDATGRYPSTLAELAPRYVLLLPQPIMFRANTWCYETAGDGYRFGYVSRAGFGARATVKVVGTEGIDSERAWQCAADAEHYNQTAFVHE